MSNSHRILIIFLMFSSGLFAQSISVLINRAEDFIANNQINDGILLYKEIDSLARIAKDSVGITMSARVLGDYYNMIGKIEEAKSLFEYAIPYSENALARGQLLHGLSTAVSFSDNFKAEQYILLSIAELEKLGQPYELGVIYGNYGRMLVSMGRFEDAIVYFKKALELSPQPIVRIQLNMALSKVLINTDNWSSAEEYILESISLAEKEGFKMRNGMPGVDYARWLIHKERYPEAMTELDKATIFFQERDQMDNLAQLNFVKALIYIKTENWAELREVLNKKQEMLSNLGKHRKLELLLLENELLKKEARFQGIIDNGNRIREALSDKELPLLQKRNAAWLSYAYEKLGKMDLAFKFLKQKEALSDSLYRSGQAKVVNRLEAEFNRKEQKREIESLEFKNNTKNKMLLGGAVFLFLLSVFSWLLYRLWRKVSAQKIVISSALKEKDVLLREIHHRVKNNLQLVSSLLTLQIDSVTDGHALEAIKEGHSRVQSMALIHQDLYHQENPTEVNGKVYLEKLTRELFATYNIEPDRIKLKLDIEDLNIDVDTLVPLGLIINELLTNALKYAFQDKKTGTLEILLKDKDGALDLWIKDDGVGFEPNDVKAGSFGTTLIDALRSQLNGKITRLSSDGTQTNVLIPNYLQQR